MTKAAELRRLDEADLDQKLADARKELFNLRFQLATGRLDNLARIATLRREVARLLTLEGQRARGENLPVAEDETTSRRRSRRSEEQ